MSNLLEYNEKGLYDIDLFLEAFASATGVQEELNGLRRKAALYISIHNDWKLAVEYKI
jgi:hypothetical protein